MKTGVFLLLISRIYKYRFSNKQVKHSTNKIGTRGQIGNIKIKNIITLRDAKIFDYTIFAKATLRITKGIRVHK